MAPISILCTVGARPNFIKMAAIIDEIGRRPAFEARLVHTGQHYSPEMSQSFFDQLGLPRPDINLGVGTGSQTQQTAEIMRLIEPVLMEYRPALVLVVGDVNSTMATALAAAKLRIPIAHVEAGLRSFDRQMPEEINRIVTDVLSDYLFASEPSGVKNLLSEGIPRQQIFLVGNVMIDTLVKSRQKAAETPVLEQLQLESRSYIVATLHRPANVDDPERLRSLIRVLQTAAEQIPVIFPVHPRTRKMIESHNCDISNIKLLPPQGYFEFLRLLSEARLVLTDSGGIQEETTILGVPCLTLRENTERPVTIDQGTNRLVGVNPDTILQTISDVLQNPPQSGRVPELWDGNASRRIMDVLESKFAN